jgi:chromosome segregation ATPase
MSTSPADPVFVVPGPQWGILPDAPIEDIAEHRSASDKSQPAPGAEVQWANSELSTIAETIEDLQNRLEQANSSLNSATAVESTEVEIGRLFVEAQRFSEDSLAKLEERVHEILSEAQAKAEQIVGEANEEAQEIRQQAQQAAFASTQTVRDLQAAIAGFTSVNAELLRELGTLNGMLTPGSAHGPSSQLGASPVEIA